MAQELHPVCHEILPSLQQIKILFPSHTVRQLINADLSAMFISRWPDGINMGNFHFQSPESHVLSLSSVN